MSKSPFTLTLEQKNELHQCKERNCDEVGDKRAAAVLAYAEVGATLRSVATEFSMRPKLVGTWKNRYLKSGLKDLMNLPRGSGKKAIGETTEKTEPPGPEVLPFPELLCLGTDAGRFFLFPSKRIFFVFQ